MADFDFTQLKGRMAQAGKGGHVELSDLERNALITNAIDGGGGSVDPEEVQELIDESLEGYYNKFEVDSELNTKSDKADTYTKSEVNALIPSVDNDIIIGALPSSGVPNTIYRVPGTNSYTDYAWDGTQFVALGTFTGNGDIDATPTEDSTNLVQSGGVWDAMNSLTDSTDETIYEDEGQVEYYQSNGAYFGFRGIATYTPQLSEESEINRIYFPPFKGNLAQAKDMLYYIGYGNYSGLLVPNNLTKIAEGTIQNVSDTAITDYVVELDDAVTIPVGNRVFICLYGLDTLKIQLLGGGSVDTTLQPYSSDDAVVFLLGADTTTPFSQNWSRASTGGGTGTTARYLACNPILHLYKSAIIPTIVDERLNERIVVDATPTEGSTNLVQSGGVWDAIENITLQPIKISLPNKIYAVVGDTLQLFYRGMVLAPDPYIYDIRINCEKGSRYERYFQYAPSASDIGTTTFSIEVLDKNGELCGTANTQLVTLASPTSPSSSKKIVCLGDSLTTHGEWPAEAARRLIGSGGSPTGQSLSNIDFCGSLEEGLAHYFGAGGWTWGSYLVKGANAFRFQVSGVTSIPFHSVYSNNGHQYTVQEVNITGGSGNILCSVASASDIPTSSGTLTRVSGGGDATIAFSQVEADSQNPLWDLQNNKMSFVPYANEYCNGSIDAIYILLTWNGLTPFKDDFATIIAQVKTFADTLHSEFPSAKLKIMGIQMPNQKDMHGYGANGGYSDKYGMTYTAMMLNNAYQEFANQEAYSSWVEYVAVAPQFDAEFNMQMTEKAVNTRNTETEIVGNNGVHPAHSGYMQIADAAYRNIIAEFCQS